MNYTGIFFALLTTLSWSICIFPFTQAARRLGSNTLNHFRLLLATILIGTIALITTQSQFFQIFTNQYLESWFWLGLSGIIGLTLGDFFAFRMYSILGTRLGSVLTTFAPGAALILGLFLTGEKFSVAGLTGMLITIYGVCWISINRTEMERIPDHGHGGKTKGVIYGIIGACCQGAGLVLAKKGLELTNSPINPVHATFIRLSVSTGSLFLFSILRGRIKEIIQPIIVNRNDGIKHAIAGTVFGPILGVTFSLYTVSFIDASVAQTIFSLVPVAALFIAHFFLRERITMKAITGVFIAVVGVIILIWRDKVNDLL